MVGLSGFFSYYFSYVNCFDGGHSRAIFFKDADRLPIRIYVKGSGPGQVVCSFHYAQGYFGMAMSRVSVFYMVCVGYELVRIYYK